MRARNGFNASLEPPDSGYRDLKLWVVVRIQDLPLIVEVQLQLLEFYSRKSEMHVVYRYRRGDFDHCDESTQNGNRVESGDRDGEGDAELDKNGDEHDDEDDDDDDDNDDDDDDGSDEGDDTDGEEDGPEYSDSAASAMLAKVQDMLDSGDDPNCRDERGRSVLALAVQTYSAPAVRILLDAKADPNLQTNSGTRNTPLHILAKAGARGVNAQDTLAALVLAGADVNLENGEGWTPLHLAARHASRKDCSLLESLLQSSADIHASTFQGTTALHLAAKHASPDAVTLLIDRKARVLAEAKSLTVDIVGHLNRS